MLHTPENMAFTFQAEWRWWTTGELDSRYRPSGGSCDLQPGDMGFRPGEPWEVNSGVEERKQVTWASTGLCRHSGGRGKGKMRAAMVGGDGASGLPGLAPGGGPSSGIEEEGASGKTPVLSGPLTAVLTAAGCSCD